MSAGADGQGSMDLATDARKQRAGLVTQLRRPLRGAGQLEPEHVPGESVRATERLAKARALSRMSKPAPEGSAPITAVTGAALRDTQGRGRVAHATPTNARYRGTGVHRGTAAPRPVTSCTSPDPARPGQVNDLCVTAGQTATIQRILPLRMPSSGTHRFGIRITLLTWVELSGLVSCLPDVSHVRAHAGYPGRCPVCCGRAQQPGIGTTGRRCSIGISRAAAGTGQWLRESAVATGTRTWERRP